MRQDLLENVEQLTKELPASKKRWLITRTLKLIERQEAIEVQILQKYGKLREGLLQELRRI